MREARVIVDDSGQPCPPDHEGMASIVGRCSNKACGRYVRVDRPCHVTYYLKHGRRKGMLTSTWTAWRTFTINAPHGQVFTSRFPPHIGCPTCGFPVLQPTVLRTRKSNQKCDTRCLDATGDLCVCACGGRNHGLHYLEDDV